MPLLPGIMPRIWRAGASADRQGVIQFSLTNTGVVTIALTGIAGKTLLVDAGDGSALDTVNFTGGSTPWVHDYAGLPGSKTVKFYGSENILTFNSTGFAIGINLSTFKDFRSCTNPNITGAVVTGPATVFNRTNFPVVSQLIIRTCGLAFEPYQLAGMNNTPMTVLYCYGNNGTGDIAGFAALKNVTNIRWHTNSFTYLNTTAWPAYNGITIESWSCLSTADEVDRILIDWNTSLLSNCTLKLDGTNPAPTAAAAVAIAQLTARGCVITTS